MDPDLSPDQLLLLDTTARFVEATLPVSRVRQLIDSGASLDAGYTPRVAELGWFAFLGPEALGGGGVSGEGLRDAAIFAELRGRSLQPGTFIDTNVIVATLTEHGTDEQRDKVVPTLVGGEASAAWAIAGATGDWFGHGGVRCETRGGRLRIDGLATQVVEAQTADWILVSAASPEGPTQLLVAADSPGIQVAVPAGLDLTRRLCQVRFDDVEVEIAAQVGMIGGAAKAISTQLQIACVLSVAESVGAMQELFDLSLQYAKDRVAFGRPIGSFQALKHQLADTSLALEMSHACAAGAARAVQLGQRGAAAAASAAKAFVGDAAVELAHKSWQIFGGISYTWEHDFHLYLRRLTTDASLYGNPTWHRERLCQLAGV